MHLSRRRAVAGGCAATLVLAGLAVLPVLNASADTPAGSAASSGGIKVAYYEQWSIYQNAFYPKNLDTEGIAGKLDFLNYAFANIDPVNLTCFEATKSANSSFEGEKDPNAGDGAGDAYADYQKTFDAGTSVSGAADTWNQPLVGNFNQLKQLKEKYPKLKILMSIGGWTYSKYFSDAAASDASRKKFVSSCVDLFIEGNLPQSQGFGGPGTAAGIFDGFDIDWEYPGSSGGHLGNHTSPDDKANFTALLAEFRSQLDAFGSANGRTMHLTAALPSGQDKIMHIETDKIGQYLDYGSVMTFDMHGGWEPQGPANFQAPLYLDPNDPSPPVKPGNGRYSIDNAMTAWTKGDPEYGIPGGFPANKLVMGFPFYYRGWTGVQEGGTNGLYQPASGPATGRPLSGNVPGVAMYKELTGIVDNEEYTFFDPTTQAAWFYNGKDFWAGDSPKSIQARVDYLHCHGLAGAMMWALDDLGPGGTLFNALVDAVSGSPSSCSSPPPAARPPASPSPSASPSQSPSASPSPSPPPNTAPNTALPLALAQPNPSLSPSPSPSTSPGDCGVPAWNASTAYVGGQKASYNGREWAAKWWTQGDTPGANTQNVWTDEGPC